MKFVSSREIRVNPRPVFDSLGEDNEVVVTSHGKPIALMVGVSGEDLEETLRFLRRAKAQAAVSRMRMGEGRMSDEEIEAEIRAARDERRES
ncbi:MAG: type II toxin-antitoxin system Phd/YefM family antitoxin [Rubrobacter sp.]|jgi:antitoxin (DNA-binding transcriptional repressor) of toxin-antitoxin stability system|nr:type II toxin-antitoxin system Phd/YefM family antitoxin [Rubrobacter sp.]